MDAVIRSVILAIVRNGAAGLADTSAGRRTTVTLCCGIAAAALAAAAVGCAVTALWIWCLPLLGPVGAPLAVAGVLVVAGRGG